MADAPVFLITGASSGIGAATARQAAEAGYRLVLAARSADKLEALADELGGDDRASPSPATSPSGTSRRRMVATTLDEFGRIDVVFANAGFGARARLHRGDAGVLAGDGPDQRLRRRADDPRDARPAAQESKGHLLLTSSVAGRRALPGLALLGHQVRGHGDGRVRAPGASTTPACA